MATLFSGPRLKIRRAHKHIDDLIAEFEAFIARKPYIINVAEDRITGKQSLLCNVREAVPEEWAAVVGDAVHNMRSALDLLANDLVALNDKTAGNASFPIFKTKEVWSENRSRHKGVSPAHEDILLSLQPFNNPDLSLRELHDLDIKDKHKLLIPTVSALSAEEVKTVERSTGLPIASFGKVNFKTSAIDLRQVHLDVFPGHDYVVDMNFDVVASLLFGELDIDGLKGADVFSTLERLAKTVAETVDLFET